MEQADTEQQSDETGSDLGLLSKWTLPIGVAITVFAIVQGFVIPEDGNGLARIWLPTLVGAGLGFHGATSLSAAKRHVLLDGRSVFAGVAAIVVLAGTSTVVNLFVSFSRFYGS